MGSWERREFPRGVRRPTVNAFLAYHEGHRTTFYLYADALSSSVFYIFGATPRYGGHLPFFLIQSMLLVSK